jgi:putative tryptophan/tyrosine transport system substrate-binding protein
MTILAAELDAKRLQLLHEAVPLARRVAALLRPPENREAIERAMRDVAVSAGLELYAFDTASPADYPAAFAQMRNVDSQALVITSNPQLYHDGAQLAALALEARLPTICQWANMARTGCLIGYGPSLREMRRRAGEYVARIFQGALPDALPIEGPTHFEFVLNLKTARALGIDMPQGLLLRADEVIE